MPNKLFFLVKKLIRKILFIFLSSFIFVDFITFLIRNNKSRFSLNLPDLYPQIKDKTIKTGFDRHYVYHTAWAARVLKETHPESHTDISSSLYFSGIVSAFVPVKFYDYRPADIVLDNLTSEHADLMKLPFAGNSVASLSCMHVIEHIGLGRYGDPIDPDGDLKAIAELNRVLAVGGSLLFVVPMGAKARIQFNAHRIYTYTQVMSYFPDLKLKEFAFIPEQSSRGGLIRHADSSIINNDVYGCGCFWFTKE